MVDFAGLGLAINLAIFAAAACVVWGAGVRITHYANTISEATGVGQALVGMLLLGGVTSLPELAVAVSSAAAGDGALAVNSILGGIAMQVAILALADRIIGASALTSQIPNPIVLLQGALKILLLSVVAAAIVVGDRSFLGLGIWMWLLLALTGCAMLILSQVRDRRAWRVVGGADEAGEEERAHQEAEKEADRPLGRTLAFTALAATVIVAAGYVLSRTGDAIAEETGLGESFVGAVLVAIATSLPEMSTVFTAARAGLYTMAVSDIFGTNIFDVSFLVVIDAVSPGNPILNTVGPFSTFATLIGITVTATLLVGMVERRDRTVLRMGYDTIAVLVCYLSGLVVLYFLR
ncbi:MAG: sodium:calcium antiporter [Alphaproteobacteria bacterium]